MRELALRRRVSARPLLHADTPNQEISLSLLFRMLNGFLHRKQISNDINALLLPGKLGDKLLTSLNVSVLFEKMPCSNDSPAKYNKESTRTDINVSS